jgi:hypothetical protein
LIPFLSTHYRQQEAAERQEAGFGEATSEREAGQVFERGKIERGQVFKVGEAKKTRTATAQQKQLDREAAAKLGRLGRESRERVAGARAPTQKNDPFLNAYNMFLEQAGKPPVTELPEGYRKPEQAEAGQVPATPQVAEDKLPIPEKAGFFGEIMGRLFGNQTAKPPEVSPAEEGPEIHIEAPNGRNFTGVWAERYLAAANGDPVLANKMAIEDGWRQPEGAGE